MAAWVVKRLPSETWDDFILRETTALRPAGALQARIAEIDRSRPFRRIYIVGCGRSGTWLATALFATFADIDIFPHEVPVELFGLVATEQKILLLKRNNVSYRTIGEIPPSIEIVAMVRHPFAVLTSHNPTTSDSKYHISPERWLGEMAALRHLVETRRSRSLIVRYEDLVSDPQSVQTRLAAGLHLSVRHAANEAHKVFKASPEAVAAMHGLRPIDTRSLDAYRQSPEKIDYLRRIIPDLGDALDWVAAEFGYDVRL